MHCIIASSIMLAVISILTHLLALSGVFFTLCVLCDDHLVPTVELFIVQFQVPEEVAGQFMHCSKQWVLMVDCTAAVTLVAFGSAAPELFLNSVSAVAHTSDLSMSAILGSGMIAFGLIPALCVLGYKHYEVKLHLWPVLREVIELVFQVPFGRR
jgi:Ca2+/Na+ antiporter